MNIAIGKAPEPKKSWGDRYLNGVKRAVTAPFHLVKDTGAKVVDIGTQGFAVIGKATGGWDVGYTTWSSTSKAVEAGVSQKELLWQATGGLVVNPIIAVGDVVFKQDPDALGEIVGGVMVGGVYKGFKSRGGGNITQGAVGDVVPRSGKTFKYTIDGVRYAPERRNLNYSSQITRDPGDVQLYQRSLARNWEYARYDDPISGRRRIRQTKLPTM